MKQISTLALLSAAALAAALLAAPAARAFTFEGQAPGDSGGTKSYVDPTDSLAPGGQQDTSRFDGNGQGSIYRQGGFSLRLNQPSDGQSFDQRYNANNLFDPYAREGR